MQCTVIKENQVPSVQLLTVRTESLVQIEIDFVGFVRIAKIYRSNRFLDVTVIQLLHPSQYQVLVTLYPFSIDSLP